MKNELPKIVNAIPYRQNVFQQACYARKHISWSALTPFLPTYHPNTKM